MQPGILYVKAKRRLTSMLLAKIAGTSLQFSLYRSYWHMRLSGKSISTRAKRNADQFLGQQPNYSAGIGHQLANWNTGFYYADTFNCSFAHFRFSNAKWEYLLGFGENEIQAPSLLKDRNYRKVALPRFDSTSETQTALIRRIIESYQNKGKILFTLALDQGYMQQCGTYKALSDKFFSASARAADKVLYTLGNLNIAIHIRRGDVAAMKASGDENWKERWLTNDYYVNVLKGVLTTLNDTNNVQVYLFSQGAPEDFPEFAAFSNVNYCLEVNAYDSFVNMVHADILISSKSSFSYKPALISKGIKICPGSFWHDYPATENFIITDDRGNFDYNKLSFNLKTC